MSTLESIGQIRKKAIALLVGIFLAGALAGAGAARLLCDRPHRPWPRPPGPFAELGLSEEQQAKARETMEKYRPSLDAIFEEMQPRLREVRSQMDGEMKQFLTPEQVRKLEELSKHPPMGPGPGPGPGRGPPHRVPETR